MSAPLETVFNGVSASAATAKDIKKSAPYSIRLTAEERAYLEEQAGSGPLSGYIRAKLLGERADKRRVLRNPKLEEAQYAALLAALGESRLSSNLNQLARHANMGTLDISDEIEEQLQDAYEAVLEMRKALILALGLKFDSRK